MLLFAGVGEGVGIVLGAVGVSDVGDVVLAAATCCCSCWSYYRTSAPAATTAAAATHSVAVATRLAPNYVY